MTGREVEELEIEDAKAFENEIRAIQIEEARWLAAAFHNPAALWDGGKSAKGMKDLAAALIKDPVKRAAKLKEIGVKEAALKFLKENHE